MAASALPNAVRVATLSPTSKRGMVSVPDGNVFGGAELLDRSLRMRQGLAVHPFFVFYFGHTAALDGTGDDGRGPAGGGQGLGVRPVDGRGIVTVDLDGVPAEGTDPPGVRLGVPLVPRGAALPEAVDVDDGGKPFEPLVAGELEGLPDGALGELAVAAEHPDVVRQAVQPGAGHGEAGADGQALAERAGGNLHPWQSRRRVALQPAAEPAVAQQLLVADSAGRTQHRVQQGRGVPLGEDQVVVVGVVRVPHVVPQVAREQDGHEVGGGQCGGGVAGPGGGGAAHRVHAQLLPKLLHLVRRRLQHGGHMSGLPAASKRETPAARPDEPGQGRWIAGAPEGNDRGWRTRSASTIRGRRL